MAPITDLSWNDLNEVAISKGIGQIVNISASQNPESINISILVGQFPLLERDAYGNNVFGGVIKAMAILYDICREAQELANTSQPKGEKLNAFDTPKTQPPQGTLVPITRTMHTRADLTSVTKIIGANV